MRVGWPPEDRLADLSAVEDQVVHVALLEGDCQFQPDRPRSDNRDVVGHHTSRGQSVLMPCWIHPDISIPVDVQHTTVRQKRGSSP